MNNFDPLEKMDDLDELVRYFTTIITCLLSVALCVQS